MPGLAVLAWSKKGLLAGQQALQPTTFIPRLTRSPFRTKSAFIVPLITQRTARRPKWRPHPDVVVPDKLDWLLEWEMRLLRTTRAGVTLIFPRSPLRWTRWKAQADGTGCTERTEFDNNLWHRPR
jgi:hypothetical protein